MFTGLIKNLIKLDRIEKENGFISLYLKLPFPAAIGDSVAINGVCLSISKIIGKTSIFQATEETISRSNISRLSSGEWVNIEPSMKMEDLFHGHLVYGHIDGVGKIINIRKKPSSYIFTIEYPKELSPFIAEKGSIALDGVSLTVSKVEKETFEVVIIPHTLQKTNFQYKRIGDYLNIEIDPIARYLSKIMEKK
ncbi:MAG: riboflavin synthase [candidate division WOR-3 bacterium]